MRIRYLIEDELNMKYLEDEMFFENLECERRKTDIVFLYFKEKVKQFNLTEEEIYSDYMELRPIVMAEYFKSDKELFFPVSGEGLLDKVISLSNQETQLSFNFEG